MFMYKIIHGYIDLNFSDFFSVCQSELNLHRHGFTIKPLKRPCMEHLNKFLHAHHVANYLTVLFLFLLLLPLRIA